MEIGFLEPDPAILHYIKIGVKYITMVPRNRKMSAEEFGFSPDALPENIAEFVSDLEQAQARVSGPLKKGERSAFRIEAEHYWREACGMKFESPNSFVAHALGALRERFRREIRDLFNS